VHIVALELIPVERLLRTICAISVIPLVIIALFWATTTRKFRSPQRLRRSSVREVALEGSHVILHGARVWLVYPKPRANALAIWARGHIRRDPEIRVKVPDTRVVHAEYDKVVRLYIKGV
jgi:hypothetical protein